MNYRKHFESGERPASSRNKEFAGEADWLSQLHRASWKEALGKIASPAFRLHNYRHVHNRLLQNALCELDCNDNGDCST